MTRRPRIFKPISEIQRNKEIKNKQNANKPFWIKLPQLYYAVNCECNTSLGHLLCGTLLYITIIMLVIKQYLLAQWIRKKYATAMQKKFHNLLVCSNIFKYLSVENLYKSTFGIFKNATLCIDYRVWRVNLCEQILSTGTW